MKAMFIVMLALFAMAVAEEETMNAEEQTLISYGGYPYGRYGVAAYGAYPFAARAAYPYAAAAYPYAAAAYTYPTAHAFRSVVAAAPYNYNFLDTTKEPSAYLPGAYPYGRYGYAY